MSRALQNGLERLKALVGASGAPVIYLHADGRAPAFAAVIPLDPASEPRPSPWLTALEDGGWDPDDHDHIEPGMDEQEDGPPEEEQGNAILTLIRAALHVRDGQWMSAAPSHVLVEVLEELKRRGWELRRSQVVAPTLTPERKVLVRWKSGDQSEYPGRALPGLLRMRDTPSAPESITVFERQTTSWEKVEKHGD